MRSDLPVFIGASTGGTEAIKHVLSGLPADMPPIFIVQHMPEMFTPTFAQRLDSQCALRVVEASQDEIAQRGTAYLAPGHSHMRVVAHGVQGLACRLDRGEPVNRHRPSVDVLFDSAAQICGRQSLGVLLTGMGKDGARGLLAMREAGAWTIGQDEASSVVYGMPREAMAIGAVREQAALDLVPGRILSALQGVRRL